MANNSHAPKRKSTLAQKIKNRVFASNASNHANIARTPVVYTMGKVASTSTSQAIAASGLPCFDIHSLNTPYLLRTSRAWLAKDSFPPGHICTSMAHREKLFLKRRKCIYISLVRDPIARNISAYFQNLWLRDVEVRNEEDAEVLFANFLETYNHFLPLKWFDREFKNELKIDIYRRPFPAAQKYVHLKNANTVLFRIDCPDEVKSQVLSKVLGRPIEVKRHNDGSLKDYSERYRAVMACAKFPTELVDKIYDSQFSRHFWTPDERAAFRDKWT